MSSPTPVTGLCGNRSPITGECILDCFRVGYCKKEAAIAHDEARARRAALAQDDRAARAGADEEAT